MQIQVFKDEDRIKTLLDFLFSKGVTWNSGTTVYHYEAEYYNLKISYSENLQKWRTTLSFSDNPVNCYENIEFSLQTPEVAFEIIDKFLEDNYNTIWLQTVIEKTDKELKQS